LIFRATALVRERLDTIATAMALEQGKTLPQSRLEILRGCEIIE
jgi:succinate-semialdehyde dehydrogenase/glutarate-semialdehyde dehydrogenase